MVNVSSKGYARLIMLVIGLQLIIAGLLVGLYFKKPETTQTLNGDTVLSSDKVKIEYYELENGDFDILVTPLNEYNISPEYTLIDKVYYKDGYIVGKTRDSALKVYDNSDKDWAFKWNELGGII